MNTSRGTVVKAGEGVDAGPSDWAMIRLDRCLGDQFGFFPIARQGLYTMGSTAVLHPRLIAMGFPSDRGTQVISIDPDCRATQRSTRGLLHDCAVLPGASGGPLLALSPDGKRFEAVGIVVAGLRIRRPIAYSANRANVAIDLTDFTSRP